MWIRMFWKNPRTLLLILLKFYTWGEREISKYGCYERRRKRKKMTLIHEQWLISPESL